MTTALKLIDLTRDAVFVVADVDVAIIYTADLAREDGHAELGISVLPPSRGPKASAALCSLIADPSPRGARLDPPRPRQQRLSMTDHDLAGDFAACVMAPSGLGVGEGKHAVYDRSDLMLFYHPA
jgi:hypothetical protein